MEPLQRLPTTLVTSKAPSTRTNCFLFPSGLPLPPICPWLYKPQPPHSLGCLSRVKSQDSLRSSLVSEDGDPELRCPAHGTDRCIWHCHRLAGRLNVEKNQGPDWVLEALSLLGLVRCTRPPQAVSATQSLSQRQRGFRIGSP